MHDEDFEDDEQTQKAAKLNVRFELHPVEDKGESAKEGRPIFKEVEYIEIRVPGDKDIVRRPVRDADKQEYRQQYRAWQKDHESGGLTGTPLSEVSFITKSEVKELEYFGCRTVEQLAGMSDGALKNVGPIIAIRKKAQDFMAAAKGNSPITRLNAQLEEERTKRIAIEHQLAEVLTEFKKLKPSAVDHIPEVSKPTPKKKKAKEAEA